MLIVFVLVMGLYIYSFILLYIQLWIELVFVILVVLWVGKFFIECCWILYKICNLNMWSLIGVGVLVVYIYSVVVMIFLSVILMEVKIGYGVVVYFEVVCMIVFLSLFG